MRQDISPTNYFALVSLTICSPCSINTHLTIHYAQLTKHLEQPQVPLKLATNL